MNPMEIRDKLMAGEITPDQARNMFEQARQSKDIVPHKTQHPMPMKRPPMGQMDNREQLMMVRPDLNRSLVQMDAMHFYQRMKIEENVRHAVAVPAYAIIGAIDGILDSAGYLISEIAEDLSFAGVRTWYRFLDGVQRGKL